MLAGGVRPAVKWSKGDVFVPGNRDLAYFESGKVEVRPIAPTT
jgi:hypothetical protein